jgi:hypothetical protein
LTGYSPAQADTSRQTQTIILHFNPLARFAVGLTSDGDLSINARARVGKNPTTLTQVAFVHNSDRTYSRIASVSTASFNQHTVHATIPARQILLAAFNPERSSVYSLTQSDGTGFDYRFASDKEVTAPDDEATMVYVLSAP